jgi:hypothetical protein
MSGCKIMREKEGTEDSRDSRSGPSLPSSMGAELAIRLVIRYSLSVTR